MGEGVIPPPPWETEEVPPPPFEGSKKGVPPPRSDFQKRAAKNLAENLQKGAAIDYKQDIQNAALEAGGVAVEAGVMAGAAALTGGASIPVSMALMAGGGVSAGIAREALKAFGGATDTGLVKSANPEKSLAISLGIDAGTGMFGEGLGRGIGYVSKTLLPKILIRQAAKSAAGARVLEQEFVNSRAALFSEIEQNAKSRAAQELKMASGVREGAPPIVKPTQEVAKRESRALATRGAGAEYRTFGGKALLMGEMEAPQAGKTATEAIAGSKYIDASGPLRRLQAVMSKIPRGKGGGFTERFSGMTDKAAEVMQGIEKDLRISHGEVATLQPLDVMTRAASSFQKMAWTEQSLAVEERAAFKAAAEDLNRLIRQELKDVGPKAVALFDHGNSLLKTQNSREALLKASEKGLEAMLRKGGRAMAGAAVGAGIGYHEGGLKGAVAGATGGAASQAAFQRFAPWALERVWSNPAAKAQMMRAVDFWAMGQSEKAGEVAIRAFGIAGIRDEIKEHLKSEGE